jgi:hypothetical protein
LPDEPFDRLERDVERLLLLLELPLGLERLCNFGLECDRTRGPFFTWYRVDRRLCVLEVTSIECRSCLLENCRVRSKALGVAYGSEGGGSGETHRVRRR